MKNGKFDVGTLVKGKDLKGYILCKILTEDMVMRGFQYKIGLNEDVKPLAMKGNCKAGLHFCFIKDVPWYLGYRSKLALISIPDDEDVYVGHKKFAAHRMVIEKVLPMDGVLNRAAGWECLMLNGTDITANNNRAVKWAAKRGYLEVVKCLHEYGADITASNNYAVRWAAENGHLGVVRYLHENGADITAEDNYAVRRAAVCGHLEVVEYLHGNGADITAEENEAVRRAARNGYLEVVKYLQANM